MDIRLQLVLIFISLITFFYVIHRIRKSQLNINDAIPWIIWVIAIIVLSVFFNFSQELSNLFGFESTSNFILTLFIFFLYILLFQSNIQISKLREQNKILIQKISIYMSEKDNKDQTNKTKSSKNKKTDK